MSEAASRSVAVVGLGRSGVAAAALARRGGHAVVAFDTRDRNALPDAVLALERDGVQLHTGQDAHQRLRQTRSNCIVVSPGVPRLTELSELAAAGVEIISEIEWACRFLSPPAIAITGSNGKSTTTMLVGELLARAGLRPFVGGNLGQPPSEIALTPEADEVGALVLEISSFQAERLPTFRPRVGALLNLAPNHLDRYDGYDDYCNAKGNLFVNQTEADVAVVPTHENACRTQAERGSARIRTFGRYERRGDVPSNGVGVLPEAIVDGISNRTIERRAIRLAGEHNALNVAAALAMVADDAVADDDVYAVLASFEGLPHRLRLVKTIGGVSYYNDSKGTNVGAAVAAIAGLSEERVVLIAGGRDKMGSYDTLVDAMQRRGRAAIVIGEAADRLAEALGPVVEVQRADSLANAVQKAAMIAMDGDAVLLSPACSSFDMFRSYAERGDAFEAAVHALA